MIAALPTPVVWLLIAATAGVPAAFSWTGQAAGQRNNSAGILSRGVKQFDLDGATPLEGLLRLGQQEHIPMGIEYVSPESVRKLTTIHLRNTTVSAALKAILGNEQGYWYRVDDGVLDISNRRVPTGRGNLLNRVLPEFSIPRAHLSEASNALDMTLFTELYHPKGIIGDYPGDNRALVGPLNLKRVTVRQSLNAVVRQAKDAAWIVRVPPRFLGVLPPAGLWIVVEYTNAIRMGSIARELRASIPATEPARSGDKAE